MEELTGRQRRFLRGLANQLEARVWVGREGLTPAVTQSLKEAFNNQELVKVRLERTCPLERKQAAPLLADAAQAQVVQILGQTVLLYQRDEEAPRIQLPD